MNFWDEMESSTRERHQKLRNRVEDVIARHGYPDAAMNDAASMRDLMDLADAWEADQRAAQAMARLDERYPGSTPRRLRVMGDGS